MQTAATLICGTGALGWAINNRLGRTRGGGEVPSFGTRHIIIPTKFGAKSRLKMFIRFSKVL